MKTSISKFSLVFFTLLGAATTAQAQSAGQSKVAVPSMADKASVEVDFWKSVERMDTADAYAAYLETYPNGRFALLARVAMKRSSGGQPVPTSTAPVTPSAAVLAPAVVPTPIPSPVSALIQAPIVGGKLNAWSEPASGAITLDAGNRIRGPGVITVGRIGAKKQLPIPEGEWVVLAATDHESETQPRYTANGTVGGIGAVKLTSMTLAQFDGTTARSVLHVTFNRVAHDMPRFVWKGAEQCLTAADPSEYHDILQTSRSLKLCTQVRVESASIDVALVPAHRNEISRNLGQLGGRLGVYNTGTDFYLVDRYNNYMLINRLDCVEAQQARPACALPTSPPASMAAHIAWAKNFAPSAYTGFDRNLAVPELSALEETRRKD
jgi:hypothetical protein